MPQPLHARGTRNLGSGGRSLFPPSRASAGFNRAVCIAEKGKPVTEMLQVYQPFPDGRILIACQKRGRIERGNVLVRNRRLAERLKAAEVFAVYPDLHAAIRAWDEHAKKGYADEAELLQALTGEELPQAMAETFDLAGISKAGQRAWARKLNSIADQLKLARDPGKAEAYEKLARAANPKDALGRHNPPATRARVIAARSRLEDRQENVAELDAYRAKVAAQLKVVDLRMQAMILSLRLEVERVRRRVQEARSGRPFSRAALASCLGNEARHFASKDVNPYRERFQGYAKELAAAATAIMANRLDKAAAVLNGLAQSLARP